MQMCFPFNVKSIYRMEDQNCFKVISARLNYILSVSSMFQAVKVSVMSKF